MDKAKAKNIFFVQSEVGVKKGVDTLVLDSGVVQNSIYEQKLNFFARKKDYQLGRTHTAILKISDAESTTWTDFTLSFRF